MKQSAPISLDSFDPEVLAAAREVAKRAGVPLETWIQSVVAPDQPTPTSSPRRRHQETAQGPAENGAQAAAPDPVPEVAAAVTAAPQGEPGEATEVRETPPKRREAPPAETAGIDASLNAMMRRLEALDRSIHEEREASKAAAAQMIGEIETRLAATLQPTVAPAAALTERLADIERKMGDLATQITTPRPLGRRGRPLASEVRDAVAEVRRRQRELEGAAGEGGVAAEDALPVLREDEVPLPSPAIAELQRETTRLRDSLGGLATGRDVGALEQAMRALVTDIQRAREPDELAAIAAPIELMRVQVERLAEDVADNVHARVAGEVERLATKVDGALAGASPSFADRDALGGVFKELDEIRRLVAALAGPERIQSLAQGVHAISAQIAQLQRKDASVAELMPLLEEIRSELKTPDESREILGRFEALADRMDRVNVNPVGDLIGRLETLGENLRQQPAAPARDFSSIEGMLQALAEKVDRVSAGGNGLDALEKHVVALAHRLDAPNAVDPALNRLERSMSDLLAQVSAMREAPNLDEAVERVARQAVAGAAAGAGKAADGAIGQVRADIAEMRTHQLAADQRLQTTMEGVQSLLARLSDQLDRTMTSAAALATAAPARAAFEHVLPETQASDRAAQGRPVAPKAAPPSPRGRPVPRPEAGIEADRLADELLEPGAGRPAPGRAAAPETGAEAGAGMDIKTSFIAAARRAAQAAQAETAAEPPITARLRERMSATGPRMGESRVLAQELPSEGPVSRMRAMFEKRRRTLLLGLAAVVLALGAYQAFLSGNGVPAIDEPAPAPTSARIAPAPAPSLPETAENRAFERRAEPAAPAHAHAGPTDPVTTQSIGEAAAERVDEALAKPAPRALPQVASMASLGAELANVPPALSKLRQSALDGDAAAIWELASREADGRGLPRDLAVAAKLYEKLAGAGYAPAQFKIGNAYEKGSGVIRDIALAKLWYGRAADQGNIRAMHNLAVLHAENPAANGKPDFATAAGAFRRAAEHGVRDSQYNLAVLYARGLGVSQDLVQSYLWFSAAAAQGDEEAGRKRDEVTGKLAPKDLAQGKALVAAFKAKTVDPAVNEPPVAKTPAAAPMSLMGAPSPGLPNPNPFQKRAGV